MGVHINKTHDIASTVLLPGDPLRAKWIAENFLEGPKQYTSVRNMLGYTGYAPNGRSVSVQGTGMGMPSLSIYVNELADYGVKQMIRVGTCGGLREDISVRDIILVMGSCSDSNINRRRFKGMNFAPIADWSLLRRAYETALQMGMSPHVGNNVAVDLFYNNVDRDEWKLWAKYGVLTVEMETAELYTLAASRNFRALTILTVSDVLPTGEALTAEERERTLGPMVELALQLA